MFEKIKEKWNKRIQRNAISSVLTHANKNGIKLMKQGKTLEELPDNYKVTEKVFFKRSVLPLGDWTRIYPPVSEDGRRVNLLNLIFGGRRNLIKLIILLAIIGFVFLQFYENFTVIETLRNANKLCGIVIN